MIEGFVTVEISLRTKNSQDLHDVSHIIANQYSSMKKTVPTAHLSSGKICRGVANIKQSSVRNMLHTNGMCKIRIPEKYIDCHAFPKKLVKTEKFWLD